MNGTKRSMRYGRIVALVTGLSCVAGAQTSHGAATRDGGANLQPAVWQGTEPTVKDDLFAGTEKFAKNASDVTEVTMDPDTLDMVNGSGARRAHNMVLNVVRTYSYDKPGMYRMEDVEEFRRKLNTGDWHCSVHTRDLKSGESTDICNRRRTDGLVESAIVTVEPKELTFIHTIRKRGDGESRVDPESMLEMGLPDGLPPAAMIALMRPRMDARMEAAMAKLQAHSAELQAFAVPRLNEDRMQQQMKLLREQMQHLNELHAPIPESEQLQHPER